MVLNVYTNYIRICTTGSSVCRISRSCTGLILCQVVKLHPTQRKFIKKLPGTTQLSIQNGLNRICTIILFIIPYRLNHIVVHFLHFYWYSSNFVFKTHRKKSGSNETTVSLTKTESFGGSKPNFGQICELFCSGSPEFIPLLTMFLHNTSEPK